MTPQFERCGKFERGGGVTTKFKGLARSGWKRPGMLSWKIIEIFLVRKRDEKETTINKQK